ncbi:hypothetical protein [Burkholderia cepacia]|uniref:hypothetical protein n=1 Tax=Burkholderia cepacia TaxID=292 RepID=UPI0012D8DB9B|nr:hypothetical protein [Burkholderia cepacia]
MKLWKTLPVVVGVVSTLSACNTMTAPPLPDDTMVTLSGIIDRSRLTDVVTPTSLSGPSVGVGGGAISGSGIGSGGFVGAGLGFDLSRLFSSREPEQSVIYRYRVQMPDGTTREIDSAVDVPALQCVDVIESGQPGYPHLRQAACPQ